MEYVDLLPILYTFVWHNYLTGIGNPRGNENPFMLSYAIIWFRYHNYWAARLKSKNPTWNDERLFNEARKRVIGQYQVEYES